MDLSFSAAEVAVITAMLGVMGTAVAFVTRQLLAAKQETIVEQGKTIARQDQVSDRTTRASEELRDVVREQNTRLNEQNRNIDGLRAQMAELTRELIDRRPVINEILEIWKREHESGRRREDR